MTPDKMATPDKMGRSGAHGSRVAAGAARIASRMAVSAPAGLAALLIVGAVAFGHEGLFPRMPDSDEGSATPKPHATAEATTKPSEKPTQTAKPTESAGPDEMAYVDKTPKPAATPKPAKPEATPKPPAPVEQPKPQPQPAPVTTALSLSVQPSEHVGKVLLNWSAYSGDAFAYYKLVRSHDANVNWPTSGDDELIGAFATREEVWAKDRPACGMTFFYRVFAVGKGDHGYPVLAPSNTVSAATTCPPPPPATQPINLEASFSDGAVNLAWAMCPSADFNAYKVVRSQTNPDPMYPENDGTELLAAIGNPSETWFADTAVASGQTWFYRVLARADNGGGHYIACQTQAVSVTIP